MTRLKVVCVTDRKTVREDFLSRIARLAAARPDAILLRERDLNEADYEALAARCRDLCRPHGVELIVHGHADIARRLGLALHLPLALLRAQANALSGILAVGASVHAADEAREAAALGAKRLIAGHIYATASKPGMPPRGLGFLAEVCRAAPLPVFAIGGIAPENADEIAAAGAAGVCILSSAMVCADPAAPIAAFTALR